MVYLDARTSDLDIHCPESVAEEIVETEVNSDSEASTTPNSPSGSSQDEGKSFFLNKTGYFVF